MKNIIPEDLFVGLTVMVNCLEYYVWNNLDQWCIDNWFAYELRTIKNEKTFEYDYEIHEHYWQYPDGQYGSKLKLNYVVRLCKFSIFDTEDPKKLFEEQVNIHKSLKLANPDVYIYKNRTLKLDLFNRMFNRKYSIKYHR